MVMCHFVCRCGKLNDWMPRISCGERERVSVGQASEGSEGCRLITADGVADSELCTLLAVHYSRGQSPADSKNVEWTVGNVARCYCP